MTIAREKAPLLPLTQTNEIHSYTSSQNTTAKSSIDTSLQSFIHHCVESLIQYSTLPCLAAEDLEQTTLTILASNRIFSREQLAQYSEDQLLAMNLSYMLVTMIYRELQRFPSIPTMSSHSFDYDASQQLSHVAYQQATPSVVYQQIQPEVTFVVPRVTTIHEITPVCLDLAPNMHAIPIKGDILLHQPEEHFTVTSFVKEFTMEKSRRDSIIACWAIFLLVAFLLFFTYIGLLVGYFIAIVLISITIYFNARSIISVVGNRYKQKNLIQDWELRKVGESKFVILTINESA